MSRTPWPKPQGPHLITAAGAASEAKRRGWQNWDLGYIQERDQGWMHVVIADVARKNAVEMTPRSTQ